jgi:hypothetical protein
MQRQRRDWRGHEGTAGAGAWVEGYTADIGIALFGLKSERRE